MIYSGIVVAESLKDPTVINDLMVEQIQITKRNNYHLYQVRLTIDTIGEIAKELKEDWYMHFWQESNILVIFGGGKQFFLDPKDKASWVEAIAYGMSRGFTEDKLDFSTKGL